MKEIWKSIPEFEGIYEVSNLGEVKSIKFNKEKILKLDKNTHGYNQIKLYLNGNRKWYLVHRLVCSAFLNSNLLSNADLVVNHINGIRDDNRLENLEIISQIENIIDGVIRKNLDEDYNLGNIKYISKGNWEVYYKGMFIGRVKNTNFARVAIDTAKIIFDKFDK